VASAGLALPASASASSIIYRCGTPANLCQINPDGTGKQQLTTDGASAAYHGASIDPVGTRMIFTRDTSSLYAADGNAQNVVGPISTYASVAKISFDGSMVVDEEYYPTYNAFAICSFQTTPSSDSGWGRNCGFGGSFPAFMPDGEVVASLTDSNTGHDDICVIVIGTSGCTRNLAADPSHDLDEAAVSPDGKTLAVVAITPGGPDAAGGSIVLYSMSSGQVLKTLTNGTVDETPAWSPDSTQLVFSRSGDLYTIAAGGSPGSEHLLVAGADTPTWGGPAAPTIVATHPARLKLAKLLAGGVSVTVSANERVAAGVELALDGATAKRLKLGRGQVNLGQATGTVSGRHGFTVKVKVRYRHTLAKARRFTLYVIVVAQDASGHRSEQIYKVAITR
jgi:hypothetical protein